MGSIPISGTTLEAIEILHECAILLIKEWPNENSQTMWRTWSRIWRAMRYLEKHS